ncbi:MAG: rhomboid family intramembrane serine protease [Trueperaceae bacterium]
MSQLALLSLVVLVSGVYAVRWANRLAPPGSELPVKTLLSTALAGYVVAADLTALASVGWVEVAAATLGPLFVFAPIAVGTLARTGRYRLAETLTDVLYWTPSARDGVRNLLARLALQRGDLEAADRLIPDGASDLRIAWLARSEAWERLLDAAPTVPDALHVATNAAWTIEAARVQALLALDRTDEAADRIGELEAYAEDPEASAALRSAARLSAARLAAARGRVAETQRHLNPPPEGVPTHELFAVLATAAARGDHGAAGELWTRAYAAAPPPLRPRYAERLREAGATVPELRPKRPVGTWSLTAVLIASYLAQSALDRFAAPVATTLGRIDPSWAAAAYLLGVPGVPGGEAWWRFLSYAFVHGNLIHIALNAWVLFDIGRMLEGRRHWGDLLAAFVAGTAMGAYLTQVAQAGQVVVLVGASGGVLGVAGALLADVLRGRGAGDRMMTRSLVQWMLLITVLSVAVPGVSLWGHVGGVIGGALWGFARQGLPRDRRVSLAAGYASVAILAGIVAIVVGNGVRLLA